MPQATAIIVAAGKGTRMGPNVDKLFLDLAGKPLIAYTWAAFDSSPVIHDLVIVVRPGMEEAFHEVAAENNFQKPYQLTGGGRERQDSVWNGLQAVPATSTLVAIQDGARACTTHEIIAETLHAAAAMGAAVAAQKVTDTIKESDGGNLIARNLNRSLLWAVQTPQCFKLEIIKKALGEVISKSLPVTDDTAACELIGQAVQLVESRTPNPKATSRSDIPYMELLLKEAHGQAGFRA